MKYFLRVNTKKLWSIGSQSCTSGCGSRFESMKGSHEQLNLEPCGRVRIPKERLGEPTGECAASNAIEIPVYWLFLYHETNTKDRSKFGVELEPIRQTFHVVNGKTRELELIQALCKSYDFYRKSLTSESQVSNTELLMLLNSGITLVWIKLCFGFFPPGIRRCYIYISFYRTPSLDFGCLERPCIF